MASKVLDTALDAYLESGALHAILPFRETLDALAKSHMQEWLSYRVSGEALRKRAKEKL